MKRDDYVYKYFNIYLEREKKYGKKVQNDDYQVKNVFSTDQYDNKEVYQSHYVNGSDSYSQNTKKQQNLYKLIS